MDEAATLFHNQEVLSGANITTINHIEKANSVTSIQTERFIFKNIDTWREIHHHFERPFCEERYLGIKALVNLIKTLLPFCSEQTKLELQESVDTGLKKVENFERARSYTKSEG